MWCGLSVRQDLKDTFIDSGVMTAIKEWISPLPDKSLPALRIREELLRILMEVSAHLRPGRRRQPEVGVSLCTSSPQLPSVSQETLKHSGIGRAVMFLYKHPKESRSNKDLALKLISKDPSVCHHGNMCPCVTFDLCGVQTSGRGPSLD